VAAVSDHRVFEYEVVPIVPAGDERAEADPWKTLRSGLNQRGHYGFRVVAVVGAPGSGAVIMERDVDSTTAERESVSQAAEDITWESSR
jgi:hypothetical protein